MKCIYHAIRMFIKYKTGYIFIRRSDYCRFMPHFGWCKDIVKAKHWQPIHPKHGFLNILIHKLFAKGYIKEEK
jgi:hypothetical protein